MIMYGSVLPSYKSGKKKGTGKDDDDNKIINADDPRNRAKVREILFGE